MAFDWRKIGKVIARLVATRASQDMDNITAAGQSAIQQIAGSATSEIYITNYIQSVSGIGYNIAGTQLTLTGNYILQCANGMTSTGMPINENATISLNGAQVQLMLPDDVNTFTEYTAVCLVITGTTASLLVPNSYQIGYDMMEPTAEVPVVVFHNLETNLVKTYTYVSAGNITESAAQLIIPIAILTTNSSLQPSIKLIRPCSNSYVAEKFMFNFAEPENKKINVLGTSGTIALKDNSINTITPTDAVTFTLPTITNNNKFHQILVQVDMSTVYTIDFGATCYFNDKTPSLSSIGMYDLIYEYDRVNEKWVCGAMQKGNTTSVGCLLGTTEILLADNTTKQIKDIKAGDVVVSYNENEHTYEPTTVYQLLPSVKSDVVKITFEDDSFIELTSGHAILSERGWVAPNPENTTDKTLDVKALVETDKILSKDEQYLGIKSIQYENLSDVDVYDLAVSKNHNFIADNIVVHNAVTGGAVTGS